MTDSQHRQALAVFRYGPLANFVPLPKGHDPNRGLAAAANAADFSRGLKRAGHRA